MRPFLLLTWAVFVTTSSGNQLSPCPTYCQCSDAGNHRTANCSDILELQKYIKLHKDHTIDMLNLSHNKITKINGQLDKLTELKMLDLSHNDIHIVSKLLSHSRNLRHLDLSHNNLKEFKADTIPATVNTLNLSYNYIANVPDGLVFLENLQNLDLSGNQINCTCSNLELRDSIRERNVIVSDTICAGPDKLTGVPWRQIKTTDYCKKENLNMLDMMMGDEPGETEIIGPETTNEKSMQMNAAKDLDEGEVWEGSKNNEDDDEGAFLTVSKTSTHSPDIDIEEGSGQQITDETFVDEHVLRKSAPTDQLAEFVEDEVIPANMGTTEEAFEGSGDYDSVARSMFVHNATSDPFSLVDGLDEYADGSGDMEDNASSTTTESFITGIFNPFFLEGNADHPNNTTKEEEFEIPERPTLFQGKIDWDRDPEPTTEAVEEVIVKVQKSPVETGLIDNDNEVDPPTNGRILLDETLQEDPKQTKKTSIGTYVCLVILAVLLVGLIMFAFVKGQMRKRRDRRLMRQQRKDAERGGKEMVDMSKSLLGKPATLPGQADKKLNGKYEMVPTHEVPIVKGANGDLENRALVNSHVDSAPPVGNGETSKPHKVDVSPPRTNGKLDRGSVSSEEIFVPHEDDKKSNGIRNPSGPPIANGAEPSLNNDYVSPGREYIPVYSPDMGRVRIKLSETPKPVTPVLVTRTRSNAGDIIITPNIDQRPITKTTS